MKSVIRTTALLWIVAFVSVLCRAEPATATAPTGSQAELIFNGVFFVGQNATASISDRKTGESAWLTSDQPYRGYTVKEITAKSVVLVDSHGAETMLTLASGGRNDGSPVTGAKPEPYTKAWINSTANPMVRRMQPLPRDVSQKWATMTAEEKAAIIEMYRKHGWQLVSSEVAEGFASFAWENIYGEERKAVLKANRAAFEATLSPDQKVQYQGIRAAPVFGLGGVMTPERQKEAQKVIADHQHRVGEFTRTRTPEQREAYEATTDFTKAKWTD